MIYLYKHRESAGLSIYKLSKLTGISRQNLMKLEKGSQPTAPVIIKLCLALGITPNDLLGWEEKLNEYKRRITGSDDD